MYNTPAQMVSQFYGPLQRVWMERIRAAEGARKRFDTVARVCNDFYEAEKGFMWKDRQYFSGTLPSPKFAITIAKAFEFVALYGPHLYWDYADRKVFSQKDLKLPPQLLGDPEEAKKILQDEAYADMVQDFINTMLTKYMNWAQREQPYGGQIVHAMMGINEALIKGMGLLWPETYTMPGSDSVYTKLSYDTSDNLLIDPDCRDPLWESAGYIIRKHTNPIWQVERLFELPRGELQGKGTTASAEMTARDSSGTNGTRSHKSFDNITWYEIWSRVGVGPRTDQLNHHMIDMFDGELGDFAYLCIAKDVNYPLNAHPDRFFGAQAAGGDAVRHMFAWRCCKFGDPFPFYMDNRWPVSPLIFNPLTKSPWPLAPLAPGLGELIAINVLTSSYVDTAWNNRQQILAYVKSAAEDLERVLSTDEAMVKVGLNDNIHRNINEVMQFLNRPPAQSDQLQALEMLYENFAKRVGLSELMFGESRTQIRVASDARSKSEAISIRPEKMSKDVGRWLTTGSQMELFLAIAYVRGVDVSHLVGDIGAQYWDQVLGSMPVEVIVREFKTTVEASETRRPNRERDIANVQTKQQYELPLLQAFAQQTGQTEPLNQLLAQIHEATEMIGEPITLPAWTPPKDERQQQMEMQDFTAELRKKLAEAGFKEASAQKAMIEGAAKMLEAQMPPGGMIGEMKHQQELRHKEEEHSQDMLHEEQNQIQKLLFTDVEAEQDLEYQAQKNRIATKTPQRT